MLDILLLRFFIGENVEILLCVYFILVLFCIFLLFLGFRVIGSKIFKKKNFLKCIFILNFLFLDEEN